MLIYFMDSLIDKIPNLRITVYGSKSQIKNIEGFVILSAWSGFQSRRGPYASVDKTAPSDGNVKIDVGGDMVADEPVVTQEHVNAYNFLVSNQDTIKNSILEALLNEYKNLQELYDYDPETAADIMPDVNKVSEFESLIGLSSVHLMNVSKDGTAYVGYEFGCNWDDEHGLGIMTYQDRVIEIGAADMSFTSWIAKKDLKPKTPKDESVPVENPGEQKSKKPWWKIW